MFVCNATAAFRAVYPRTRFTSTATPIITAIRRLNSGSGPSQSLDVFLEKNNDNISTIIINRPHKKNAVDFNCAELLTQSVRAFDSDSSSRVGVLWGAGGSFCAGADLSAIEKGKANRLEIKGDGPMGPSRYECSKPMIAAISGAAVAGGLELALWCDMRVMEEDAVLGVFCRRFGVPLIDGGTIRLPRLIGQSRALDLILTGRPVFADEALAIGLVNRVVPTGTARKAAEELAAQIAAFPNACMLADRASVYEQHDLPMTKALEQEFVRGLAVLKESQHIQQLRDRFITKTYKSEK